VIFAEAGILDARGSLYGAYSGVLPHVSGSLSRSGSWTTNNVGNTALGGVAFPPRTTFEDESYSSSRPTLNGSWAALNLSAIKGVSAARSGLKASRFSRQATRNDVALRTRRQFYEVVKAVRLAQVADGALRLARDDERRVRALFEVGSVSKSDLLRAEVSTSRSELDSLTAHQAEVNNRILLGLILGLRESEIGEVDTLLAVEPMTIDEASLVAEGVRNRPDLKAAETEVVAARASRTAARYARLPYITVAGSATFNTKSNSQFQQPARDTNGVEIADTRETTETASKTDRGLRGQVALTMDLFDGLGMDARNAAADARLARAQENRDALRRNMESEVHQAVLAHREAVGRDRVARRTLESAIENLKLTQEKYNVGSATILDLIDAQVQLQRAQSDGVSALADIRQAEAHIDRVRGRAQ
jgi:outer membrane protein TolC